MRARTALVLSALLVATPLVAATAATPTSRQAVPGSSPLLLKGARLVGAPSASAHQGVTLVLALRDTAGLNALMAAQQRPGSTDYHRWLTPAQFAIRFAPTSTSVAAAKSWAHAAGLTVTEVSPNRTLVTLDGTRAQLGRAFGTSFRTVRLGSSTYVTPATRATLPASLAKVTASVLGLTTYNPNRLPKVTATTAGEPYQSYGAAAYGPRDFWQIYHAPAATTGSAQTVAVITNGDLRGVRKDLLAFENRYALPKVPMTVLESAKPSTDAANAEEYDLDTQYSTGFAPGVRSLLAYNAPSLGDVHPLNHWVTDRRALTASASYGGCEAIDYLVGEVTADDQVFKQGAAQGQSMFVSTGDEGSACSLLINTGTPAGVPSAEYPASSPYVVAVGGTSLTGTDTQPTREISWIGGGGGYSEFESAPAWQKANGQFDPSIGRGVPDVSLDADPYSGFVVVVNGAVTSIGGTSASAPAWNGIWARVLQRHPRAGFAAPALYAVKSGIVDITLGANGAYATTAGYDLNTGLGSADITGLVSAVR